MAAQEDSPPSCLNCGIRNSDARQYYGNYCRDCYERMMYLLCRDSLLMPKPNISTSWTLRCEPPNVSHKRGRPCH